MAERGGASLLVLQGTPFCNLDCSYCYLPARDDRRRISPEVVGAAVDWLFREYPPDDALSIVWHAGEPMTLPIAWYEAAFAAVREAAPVGVLIRHHFQTNATLLDDRWCDFFLEHRVEIGVSIDGPADLHDLHRRTRSGKGTHAMAMRGVAILRRRVVPFHVICVVHQATLDAADRLAEFFIGEGMHRVGLNVEEIEGVNNRSTLEPADSAHRYAAFLSRLMARAEEHGALNIREADSFVAKLAHPGFGSVKSNDENTPFAIVTVTWDGAISTFSPELAGLTHHAYGAFTFGDVRTTSLSEIHADPRFRAISVDIAEGVRQCAAECEWFAFCGGGAPSNKLAENGTFACAETLHCRLSQKATLEVMLDRMSSRLNRSAAPRRAD